MSNHPSKRPTRTLAGNLRTVLLGLASGGVCLARRVTATPVRSYRTISPLPARGAAEQPLGLRRCLFCGTFPRVSPGRRYRPPRPVMSGLSSKARHPRGCSACIRQNSVARQPSAANRVAKIVHCKRLPQLRQRPSTGSAPAPQAGASCPRQTGQEDVVPIRSSCQLVAIRSSSVARRISSPPSSGSCGGCEHAPSAGPRSICWRPSRRSSSTRIVGSSNSLRASTSVLIR